MDYHVEREIRFSDESEFKNLYAWSLQEFDGDGNKIGRDQIPCENYLFFTASELRHNCTIRIAESYSVEDDVEANKPVEESEYISAILHSGICKDDQWQDDASFSMFGTDRYISHIELGIFKLDEGDSNERCELWGCVSYTTEIDMRDVTQDDCVTIYVYLSPQRFHNLAEIVKTQRADIVSLVLKGVSGFYSEWSPGVTTYEVKILAKDDRNQKIVSPKDYDITPPRLGKVDAFDLSITQRCKLNPKQDLRSINIYKLFEEQDEADEDGLEEDFSENEPDVNAALLPINNEGKSQEKLKKQAIDELFSWYIFGREDEKVVYKSSCRNNQKDRIAWSMSENLRDEFINLDLEDINEYGETSDRANAIKDFMQDLKFALNFDAEEPYLSSDEEEKLSEEDKNNRKRLEQRVWFHVDLKWFDWKEKKELPTVDFESLKGCISKYIANPDLKSQEVVWIMLDALVYGDFRSFRTTLLSGDLTGETDWAYITSKTESSYTSPEGLWTKLKITALVFFLRYLLLPSIAGVLLYYQKEQFAIWVGAVYASYIVWRIISWPWRIKARRAKTKELEKYDKTMENMINVYLILGSQAIDLDELMRIANEAKKHDVRLEGEFTALITKAKEQFGNILLPWKTADEM